MAVCGRALSGFPGSMHAATPRVGWIRMASTHAMPTMGSDEAPTATTLAPPLTDPYSWFDFYDRDASNTLDQEEVITGLYNTLQIAQKNSSSASGATASATTVDAIRESIQAIWPAFDIDGNGQVSLIWGLGYCSGFSESVLLLNSPTCTTHKTHLLSCFYLLSGSCLH